MNARNSDPSKLSFYRSIVLFKGCSVLVSYTVGVVSGGQSLRRVGRVPQLGPWTPPACAHYLTLTVLTLPYIVPYYGGYLIHQKHFQEGPSFNRQQGPTANCHLSSDVTDIANVSWKY